MIATHTHVEYVGKEWATINGNGRAKRGRRKKTWNDTVKEDIQEWKLSNVSTADRKESRMRVNETSKMDAKADDDDITKSAAMGARSTANSLDGWHYFSQKRVTSSQIQDRQPHTNKSGFVISAINKYILGSRYH